MMLEKFADHFSILGIIFVVGWISGQAYYQVPALWHQRNHLAAVDRIQDKQVKALKNCVRVAVPAAQQAIRAANDDSVPVPSAAKLAPCASPP
jgi:hypothetical protein